ncbi:MAG: hypothetical protein PVG20_01610, partial [Thioalkalispiraceae bacterium]
AMTGQEADLSLIDFNNNNRLDAGDETSGGHVAIGSSEDLIIFNANTVRSVGGTPGTGFSCPPGFSVYIRIETLADGTTKSTPTCLLGGKLGRTAWRELKF